MRVIAGVYRGKKLIPPLNKKTRPTLDRVKEAMFSILSPYLIDSLCLDLFSGSGALGIECLSRGAKKVVFNDFDENAQIVIKKNLKDLTNYKVYKKDYVKLLQEVEEKFDIILLDPPFEKIKIEDIIDNILFYQVIKENSIIMVETKKEHDFIINEKFNFKHYYYGSVKLTLLKLK